MTTRAFTHVWASCRRDLRRRAGIHCRIVAHGALKTVAIQVEGGDIIVTSRRRVRRIRKEAAMPQITNDQVTRLAILARAHPNIEDDEDLLFYGCTQGVITWVETIDDLTEDQASALIELLDRKRVQSIDEATGT